MKRLAAILLLTGCASHTAQIAKSASYVRGSVGVARGHLEAATAELDAIEAEAEAVSVNVGHVSDDENPFVASMRYGAIIIGGLAVIGIGYAIHTRLPK